MSLKAFDWFMDPVVFGPSAMASGAAPTTIVVAPLPAYALYLTEPGDTAAISVNDIHQGQIGDCFLLSPLGEMAFHEPASIAKMIHSNANGTETVTLYSNQQGGVPGFGTTSFKALTEVVTNVFPTNSVDNGASQDVVAGQKEIWPQVIEKAFAQANGGYAGIQNGGYPVVALQELTGHAASFESPNAATVVSLMRNIAAGDLVVMDTAASSNLGFNLVGSHAYMFEGLQTVSGVACVQLGNPWGFDAPAMIPVSLLSKGSLKSISATLISSNNGNVIDSRVAAAFPRGRKGRRLDNDSIGLAPKARPAASPRQLSRWLESKSRVGVGWRCRSNIAEPYPTP